MTKPAHRPTKYDPIFIDKVEEYLKDCSDRDYEFHKTRGDRSDSYEEKVSAKIPTIEGFALYLNVTRKTLYNWQEEHEDFADELDRILIEQKLRLINRGLDGTYNATIAKLVLSSNHGMKERVDNTTNDLPINPFTDEQIDKIAGRVRERGGSDGSASGKKKSN